MTILILRYYNSCNAYIFTRIYSAHNLTSAGRGGLPAVSLPVAEVTPHGVPSAVPRLSLPSGARYTSAAAARRGRSTAAQAVVCVAPLHRRARRVAAVRRRRTSAARAARYQQARALSGPCRVGYPRRLGSVGRLVCELWRVPAQMWASPGADVGWAESSMRRGREPLRCRSALHVARCAARWQAVQKSTLSRSDCVSLSVTPTLRWRHAQVPSMGREVPGTSGTAPHKMQRAAWMQPQQTQRATDTRRRSVGPTRCAATAPDRCRVECGNEAVGATEHSACGTGPNGAVAWCTLHVACTLHDA